VNVLILLMLVLYIAGDRSFQSLFIIVWVSGIDISQYRLLFGFFLPYADRVPFELLDSTAFL
jgi:hypothetical protein